MASKRRLRRKECGSKRRFESEEAANRTIGALRRSGGLQGYVHSYRCSRCGGFHFGHPPGARSYAPY